MKNLLPLMLATTAMALSTNGARALNLTNLYVEARVHDMRYAESSASYREARTLLPAARSAFLPHVSANANTAYTDLHSTILGGTGGFTFPSGRFAFNSNGYGVSVTEALLNIQALYDYRAAGQSLEASRIRYRLSASRLVLTVAQRYFGLLLAKSELRLRRAEEHALRAELARARRSFRLGTTTVIDAKDARARYEAVRAQTLDAVNAVRIARSRIEQMTGTSVRHVWPLALGSLPPPPSRDSALMEEGRAARHNLVLLAARARAKAARAQVSAASAARYPTITAEAAYTYSRAGNSEFGFGSVLRQKSIGLDLSLPIYQGGELSAASARAEARAFKAHVEVLRTEREVQFDVRQAFLDVRNGYAEVRALRVAEKAAHVALESDRLGLKVGVRNDVEVLRAQKNYYQARRDFARAVFAYLLSRLSLKAAVSELTIGDIHRLNALLRPPSGSSAQNGRVRSRG